MFEWGTKNGLELSVACLSMKFSAVKSWNFAGLICLLFAGSRTRSRTRRGFKNLILILILEQFNDSTLVNNDLSDTVIWSAVKVWSL